MIIKKGDKGENVKILQEHLHLIQDGIFGPNTEEALKDWQKEHGLKADGICGDLTWKALTGGTIKAKRPINGIIFHCTATPEGKDFTVDQIRKMHKAQGWSDIGYHYVIYRDGSVHEGRDVNKVGAHCSGHNTGTIGISYVGGVDAKGKPKDTRTEAQKQSTRSFIKRLLVLYGLKSSQVYCHNQFANKACPSFSVSQLRQELI